MKKLTSVILSVLIVVSLFSCVFTGTTVSAESTATNLSVNCIGDAEFYDVKGNKLDNEQAYTKVTTTVNGVEKSEIYYGEEVTATASYDTESGAYRFLGWYKGDKKVTTDLSVTFTAAADETYTPRFGSTNLLGGAASFEGYADNAVISHKNDANNPNPPTNDDWTIVTWFEVRSVHGEQTQHCYNGTDDASEKSDPNKYSTRQVSPRSGNVMLMFNTHSQTAVREIKIEKNTQYKLTFYVNAPDFRNRFTSAVISPSYNSDTGSVANKTLNSSFYGDNYDEWKKVEMEFNSGDNETLYLRIGKTASTTNNTIYNNCFIDDMSLLAMPTANVQFVNTKGVDINDKCANEAKPAITNSDKPGYLVAKADYDDNAFDFKGWYNGDTLLSTDKSFEFPNGAYTTLTAKVVSRNILSEAASFEGYKTSTTLTYTDNEANEEGGYPAPTSTKWGTSYQGTYFIKNNNWFKIHTVYGKYSVPCYNAETDKYVKKSFNAHSGNSMLRINTQSRSAIRALENLTPNTDYTLTFYVLGTSEKDYISCVAVAYRYDNYAAHKATASTEGTIAVQSLSYSADWQKVTLSFNSGSHETLYLHMCQKANTTKGTEGGSFIDDLTCYAENLTAGDLGTGTVITEYKASNIRNASGEKAQALRHKFEIQKDLITNGNSLYGELVEYGSVAIRTDYLGNRELVKGGVYNYNGKNRNAVTGVAYNKDEGINKIYIENENSIIFTAALTGIGKTSSGTTYAAFGNKYSVRNYLIFRNGTKETIVYTETQSYSVFDVMKAIEDKYVEQNSNGSVDEKVEADYNTIRSIFSKIPDQKNAYESWKRAQAQ